MQALKLQVYRNKSVEAHAVNLLDSASSLLHNLSVERNAHSTQQESSILVRIRGCVEGDMATGDHLGRVPGK